MPTELISRLLRLLSGRDQAEALEADPDGFLAANGLGSCTSAELAEALPEVLAALPPAEATAIAARFGPAESWGTASPAEVLVRAVCHPAPDAPPWPDLAPPDPVAHDPADRVDDPAHPKDEVDQPPAEKPPVQEPPPDEPDKPRDKQEPPDEAPPPDEPDKPRDKQEPPDEEPPPAQGPPEPLDLKVALDAARQAVADGDPETLAKVIDLVDPAARDTLVNAIREELLLEGVANDDPLMQVLDRAATSAEAGREDSEDPSNAFVSPGIDPLDDLDPAPIEADAPGVRSEGALPDAASTGDPTEADLEAIAKIRSSLAQGDVDGARGLLEQLDVAAQRVALDSLDGEALPPESQEFVETSIELRDGFGSGDDVIPAIGSELGADGPRRIGDADDVIPADDVIAADDVIPADEVIPADADAAAPEANVGGSGFFGEDVLSSDAGAPAPGSGPTVGGEDFLGPPGGTPSAPPAADGGLTPEERLELERLALEGGDAIIDNIG